MNGIERKWSRSSFTRSQIKSFVLQLINQTLIEAFIWEKLDVGHNWIFRLKSPRRRATIRTGSVFNERFESTKAMRVELRANSQSLYIEHTGNFSNSYKTLILYEPILYIRTRNDSHRSFEWSHNLQMITRLKLLFLNTQIFYTLNTNLPTWSDLIIENKNSEFAW